MRETTVPSLHVITDDRPGREVLATVASALSAGAPCVQVRRKRGRDRDRLAFAVRVVRDCHAAGARCIVNDRVDLALVADADGVHLGADDLPVAAARALADAVAGPGFLVGGTARDPDTARALVTDGCDYLGVGPVHATHTKDGLPPPLGHDGLRRVTAAVDVPVVAIAGITAARVPDVLAAGAHGIAVVGAVSDAADAAAATRDLLDALAGTTAGRS
ncbi:thiamine phosphate synthase [Egicoccus sp. AB-alg2]|uniref:thiamine phosphate synthase n=1 Tax=Egicoccus sp. AB-alg2 TaxID=3242693 RepID=UPI00359EC627